ncbi:MAG: hypothetical protein IH892_11225 [Planctomycetes bacterium]|nr:hypothetical protein [Planctomycetota bacterium]
MSFYKIFMFSMIPALAIGWVLYWLRERKLDAEEAKEPHKTTSETLKKSRSEVSTWAQQMADFKKPPGPGQREEQSD